MDNLFVIYRTLNVQLRKQTSVYNFQMFDLDIIWYVQQLDEETMFVQNGRFTKNCITFKKCFMKY